MPVSRRQLLEALGVGTSVALAGCSAAERARSLVSNPSAPGGELDLTIGGALYAPGRCVDIDHRMLSVRDIASLRQNDGNAVASALIDRPTGKAEQGFDLEPETVETYATYGPTELFTGTFDRETLVESYRSDDWTLSETHRGVDVFLHPERPEQYAGGVGDGVFLTSSRNRATAPAEFVRAHAEALAGETERYRDGPEMGELLSVVGGGDYVSAITSEPGLGERPPNTLAVGRALQVAADGITETVAFLFDESAPRTPEEYIEEWSEQWAEQVGSTGPLSNIEQAVEGRVGYFSTNRPTSTFTGRGSVVAAIKQTGPTAPMETLVDEQYTEDHGLKPPEASFTYRTLETGAEVDCGRGDNAVAVTHESGEPIPAQRLGVAQPKANEIYLYDRCGYAYGDEITAGDTVRVGFETALEGSLVVFWAGPHGNTKILPATEE